MPCYFFSLPLARAQAVKNNAVFIFCSCTSCCFYSEKKTKTLNISVKHFFFVLKRLKVFVSNLWLCQPFPGTFGSSLAFRKAAAMLATVLVWSDQYRRLQKKVDIKKMCFFLWSETAFSILWLRFCDFVSLPRDLRVLPGLQKSGSNHACTSNYQVRPVQKT